MLLQAALLLLALVLNQRKNRKIFSLILSSPYFFFFLLHYLYFLFSPFFVDILVLSFVQQHSNHLGRKDSFGNRVRWRITKPRNQGRLDCPHHRSQCRQLTSPTRQQLRQRIPIQSIYSLIDYLLLLFSMSIHFDYISCSSNVRLFRHILISTRRSSQRTI